MFGSGPRSCSRASLIRAGTSWGTGGAGGAGGGGKTGGGGDDRGGGGSDHRGRRLGSGHRGHLDRGGSDGLGGGDRSGHGGPDLLEVVGRPHAAAGVDHDGDADQVEAGIHHVGVVVRAVHEALEDGIHAHAVADVLPDDGPIVGSGGQAGVVGQGVRLDHLLGPAGGEGAQGGVHLERRNALGLAQCVDLVEEGLLVAAGGTGRTLEGDAREGGDGNGNKDELYQGAVEHGFVFPLLS